MIHLKQVKEDWAECGDNDGSVTTDINKITCPRCVTLSRIAPTDKEVMTLVVEFQDPLRIDNTILADLLASIVRQVSQLGFEAVSAECAYRARAELRRGCGEGPYGDEPKTQINDNYLLYK